MVQEARLDLSRLTLALALVGAVAPAQGQPLVPNPGLTTLLQPQRLDRSRPLVSEDRSAATRSGLRPSAATPCDRGGATGGGVAAADGSSLYGSGSGPGSYGSYMPGAPPAGAKPAAIPADRPLYGGNDRPLWDAGARRPAAAAATSKPGAARTAFPSEDAADTPAQPNGLPAPVRDRPLWAEGGLGGPLAPAASPASESAPSSAGGIGAAPCVASTR